jgi:hypothetical protein
MVFSYWGGGAGCKDVFPEELAYELVKFHLDYYKEMGEYHSMLELFSPGLFTFGQTKKTLHPGAIRAYEEAGLVIPD